MQAEIESLSARAEQGTAAPLQKAPVSAPLSAAIAVKQQQLYAAQSAAEIGALLAAQASASATAAEAAASEREALTLQLAEARATAAALQAQLDVVGPLAAAARLRTESAATQVCNMVAGACWFVGLAAKDIVATLQHAQHKQQRSEACAVKPGCGPARRVCGCKLQGTTFGKHTDCCLRAPLCRPMWTALKSLNRKLPCCR